MNRRSRRLRRALTAVIAFALIVWCRWEPLHAQVMPADGTAELRQLTERRFAANAQNDRTFYEHLIADNALVQLPNRRPLTKQEYLEHEFGSRASGFRGIIAAIHDFRAIVDRDTAVVSYLSVSRQHSGIRLSKYAPAASIRTCD